MLCQHISWHVGHQIVSVLYTVYSIAMHCVPSQKCVKTIINLYINVLKSFAKNVLFLHDTLFRVKMLPKCIVGTCDLRFCFCCVGHVLGQDSAKMTVHGLHTGDGSTITLCPNDTYLIYIECDVAGSLLQWTFGQLRNPVLFTPGFDVGLDVLRSPITVTLTEKLPNKYVSQLKTFSDELRNALGTDRAVELSCLASSNVKDTVSIVVPGMLHIAFILLFILIIII